MNLFKDSVGLTPVSSLFCTHHTCVFFSICYNGKYDFSVLRHLHFVFLPILPYQISVSILQRFQTIFCKYFFSESIQNFEKLYLTFYTSSLFTWLRFYKDIDRCCIKGKEIPHCRLKVILKWQITVIYINKIVILNF